jgi:hypothetical protein
VTVGTDVPGVNVSQQIGGDGKREFSGPLGLENSNTAGQSNSGAPSTTTVGATGYVDYTVSRSITWSQIGAGIRSALGLSPAPASSTNQ